MSNSVHAGILASDAITVTHLGRRPSGPHHEAEDLLVRALREFSPETTLRPLRLRQLLEIKHLAEYEDRLVDNTDAERALDRARHLVSAARKSVQASS